MQQQDLTPWSQNLARIWSSYKNWKQTGVDHNAKLKKEKIFISSYKIQGINNLILPVKLFPYSSMWKQLSTLKKDCAKQLKHFQVIYSK